MEKQRSPRSDHLSVNEPARHPIFVSPEERARDERRAISAWIPLMILVPALLVLALNPQHAWVVGVCVGVVALIELGLIGLWVLARALSFPKLHSEPAWLEESEDAL